MVTRWERHDDKTAEQKDKRGMITVKPSNPREEGRQYRGKGPLILRYGGQA